METRRHHRRSIRLRGYDYSMEGGYFVTICAKNRACVFGDVVDGEMRLSEIGEIVRDEWIRTPLIRPNIELDAFVVMPDHVHGIIIIRDERNGMFCVGMGGSLSPHTGAMPFRSPSKTLGAIVRGFKSASTKRVNVMRGSPGMPLWHRNYYDRIIRDENELFRIRRYIADNALQWQYDAADPFP